MTSFHIRPRFQKVIKASVEEIVESVKVELEKTTTCQGNILDNHVTIRVKPEDQHYWSPQLSLTLDEEKEGTLVRGLYGPGPNVWVLFLFGYGALGIIGVFHLIIGVSMWQMDKGSWVLWSVFAEVFLAISLYVAAQMGQKKGAEQLFRLHFFFEDVIHEKVVIE